MSQNELTVKLKELKNLQALIDEAQAEAEALRDEIKAHMGEREEMRVDCYKVTWKRVKTSRLDSRRLKAELPEVVDRFTVETETRRFCVA